MSLMNVRSVLFDRAGASAYAWLLNGSRSLDPVVVDGR